jgi:hypothetical protein
MCRLSWRLNCSEQLPVVFLVYNCNYCPQLANRVAKKLLGTVEPTGQLKLKNSMVRVSEQIIPTERPLLVGEVIANYCG